MSQDRLSGVDLPLTHQFLSVMLGVRRAGVTVAISELKSLGLVSGGRGKIQVINRRGLEKLAAPWYGVAESELKRLMNRNNRLLPRLDKK
jgi:hypothetical protein